MYKHIRKKYEAFSMIELSVYVTILGILSYFTILKANTILFQYREKALINQLMSYEAAVHVFMDKYSHIPGTIDNLSQFFKKEKQNIVKGSPENALDNNENAVCFWSQLIASELISVNLRDGMPCSPFGGRINIRKDEDTDSVWFVVEMDDDNGILEESQANNIILCYDDGNPETGNIKSKKIDKNKKYKLLYRFL